MEQWKDAVGYENYYMVSSNGRVFSKTKNKILSPSDNGSGYKKFQTIGGKKEYVHRLVAKTFIPNPDHKKEVNHIDSNPSNNSVENLEWVTSSENTNHALYKERLSPWKNTRKPVYAINGDERKYFSTLSEAERYFDSRHISDVLKGKRNHVKGWTFEYAKGGDTHANDYHRTA